MQLATKVYVFDPTGESKRSASDHAFVLENIHVPLAEALLEEGFIMHKVEYSSHLAPADLGECAALILLGGADITEELSQDVPQQNADPDADMQRDAYEMELIRAAVIAEKPILGICRGMQMLNVYFGGTLHREIADSTATTHANAQYTSYATRAVTHDILVGNSRCLSAGSYAVSSSHHQAVDRLGKRLRIAAIAPDGLVEMIEHESLPIFGVQWHPEATHVQQTHTLTPLIRALKR